MREQKRNFGNRILALLLAVVMLAGMIPNTAYSAENNITITAASGKNKVPNATVTYTVSVNDTAMPEDTAVTDDKGVAVIDMQNYVSNVGKDTVQIRYTITAKGYQAETGEAQITKLGSNIDVNLTKEAEPEPVTIKISKIGNGTVTINNQEVTGDTVTVNKGEEVLVEIAPNAGSYIKKLSVSNTDKTVAKYDTYRENITFQKNDSISVTFTAEYQVKTTPSEGGTVSVTMGGKDVANKPIDADSEVEISITAQKNYVIKTLLIGGKKQNITDPTQFSDTFHISEDIEVAVTFAKRHSIVVSHNGNGTIITDPAHVDGKVTVDQDEIVKITAKPDPGYRVSAIEVKKADQVVEQEQFDTHEYKLEREFKADNDYNVSITFAPSTYKITFSCNDNGKFTDTRGNVIANNQLISNHNGNISFKLVTESGFEVKVFDGETELKAADGVYTISGVKQEHQIKAVLTDTQPPSVNPKVADADSWKREKQIDLGVTDNSIGAVKIYVSTTEYQDIDALNAAGLTPVEAYTAIANGTYYVYAVDAAGHFAKGSVVVSKIDRVEPQLSNFTQQEDHLLWFQTVTYTFTVSDAESGVKSVTYSEDPDGNNPKKIGTNDEGKYSFLVLENGVYYIFVEDYAGNVYSKQVETSNIDHEAPVISNAQVASGWNSSALTVEFTAKDNNAVVEAYWTTKHCTSRDEILASGTPVKPVNGKYVFNATQNITYYLYALDEAQNIGSKSIVVDKIDNTPPKVDSIRKEPDIQWHNDSFEVSGTVSDKQESGVSIGSGVTFVVYSSSPTGYADKNYQKATYKEGKFAFTVPSEEFNGKYYVWAVDAVGNPSEAKEIDISIDKTAPLKVSMTYVEEPEKGFVERVNNVVSFGLIFKDKVYINVHAEDNRPGKDSGLVKYQYQMVPDGKKLNDKDWIDVVSDKEDIQIQLELEENESFLGKVYVRAFDTANNPSIIVSDTADGTTIIKDNQSVKPPAVDLNGYEEGGWTNENVTVTLTGSHTESGVRAYQYRIDYEDPDIADVDWKDMPETTGTQHQQADAEAYVQDKLVIRQNVNATYYFRAVSNTGNNSDEVSAHVKVQKTLPANAANTVTGTPGKNGWYVGKYPTVTITEPSVNRYAAPVTTYYLFWDTNKGETEPEESHKIAFTGDNAPVIDGNGTYRIKIWTEDAAGNKCASSAVVLDQIKVDITVPTELAINIGKASVLGDNNIAFDQFYKETVVIKLKANCDISGLGALRYQKVSAVSEYDADASWTEYDAEKGIVVAPNEKFVLYFKAEDNAGNFRIVNSRGIIVDDQKPVGETNAPQIDILPSKPDANGIHSGNVDVDLKVIDPRYLGSNESKDGSYSGLNKISYRIYTTDTDTVEEGVVFDLGNAGEGAVYDKDNLVSSWSGRITVNAETFNSNNVIVEVTAVDNAGNHQTSATTAGDIKIDITRPQIYVSYSNNAPNNGSYYNADRIATITITERNFDPANVRINVTNTDGTIPGISDWTESAGTGNNDSTTHTATIHYTADGDYTFSVSCKDLVGNESAGVDYAGGTQNPTEFTIDKTVPVVHVSYNNDDAANGRYFKSTRTATITITEHNFDPSKVTFTQTAGRGGVVPNVVWSDNGDTHIATFHYATDGDYTFDVTMTDIANNPCGEVDYGNCVAGKDFVIDTAFEDMISYGGVVNGKAYGNGEDVIPNLEISDTNLDTYHVTLIGVQKDKTIDLTDEVNAILQKKDQTVSGVFDIFEAVQSFDGIYTLTITAQDRAGNQDKEEIRFTVNRFGSVYVYDEYLMNLIENGGSYVKSVKNDLVITEYNADKLVKDSLLIEITLDGKPLDHVVYEVTPEINDAVKVGGSGWYQYRYTISKDNFTADGVYKISVSSKDASGNTPENSNYENMSMSFRVDHTQPEITSIVGLEESIINAQEVTVKYTVFDALGLKSVKIYVNDQLVDEITDFTGDQNNYSGQFVIGEQANAQSVQIVVTDLSGNVTDTGAEDYTPAFKFNNSVIVSTNMFVRWYADKAMFWGSIGGAVFVVGGLCFLLMAKQKKSKEKTKAE